MHSITNFEILNAVSKDIWINFKIINIDEFEVEDSENLQNSSLSLDKKFKYKYLLYIIMHDEL